MNDRGMIARETDHSCLSQSFGRESEAGRGTAERHSAADDYLRVTCDGNGPAPVNGTAQVGNLKVALSELTCQKSQLGRLEVNQARQRSRQQLGRGRRPIFGWFSRMETHNWLFCSVAPA